jgi:hypothetical protein
MMSKRIHSIVPLMQIRKRRQVGVRMLHDPIQKLLVDLRNRVCGV